MIKDQRVKGIRTDTGAPTCPRCGAPEVSAYSPYTVYACGSKDYDQRPGTFVQSVSCIPDEPVPAKGCLWGIIISVGIWPLILSVMWLLNYLVKWALGT